MPVHPIEAHFCEMAAACAAVKTLEGKLSASVSVECPAVAEVIETVLTFDSGRPEFAAAAASKLA